MKIGIFIADSNGAFPVPASKGGAVSTLVEHLVKQNTIENKLELEIITYYNKKAYEMSLQYKNTHFIWIKRPIIIKLLDEILFTLMQRFFKNKKPSSFKSLFSLAWYVAKGSLIINKREYDKVVLENNIPMAWIIKLSKYTGDYYYHFHNVPRINAQCKVVFQNCSGFLCVSQYVADQIQSEESPIGPVPGEKIQILYNCVDTKLFIRKNTEEARVQVRKKYGIQQDKKIAIFVGRLTKEKGIDILLNAAKLLKRDNFSILIVGSYIQNLNIVDSYENNLHKLTQELKDKVVFTGYVDQKYIPILYNAADVAVLPSIWDEPAGLTMIEAMACGVPVITTKSGGIPEYVSDSAIVIQRDKDLLKNIAIEIDNLLADDDYARKMGKVGAERVRSLFSSKNYLNEFYHCILCGMRNK